MGFVQFFSLAPRVGPLRWLAWLAATLGVAWLCILALQDVEGIALVATYAVLALAVGKLAIESVRRLHDCEQSGRLGLAVMAGVVALFLAGLVRSLGYADDAVSWGAMGLAGLGVAVLLLRPGTAGINSYGPPPPARFATSGVTGGKAGLLVAMGFLLAGIAFGFAVLDWQAGIDRDRELRTRISADHPTPPETAVTAGTVQSNNTHTEMDDENTELLNGIDAMLNRGEAQ
ncbi:DUF805 domain-containing protein [Sphingomonas sp. PB4P5]|uniref:DUF805 domain-containing protein n=1 Tax=Parasphingomonas puruogangriensis TaxID=3096155 RepID=UPI002FC7C8DF